MRRAPTNRASLICSLARVADFLKILAETKALHTILQRRALAAKQVLEQRFQPERALDGSFCFLYFVGRQLSPAGPYRGIILQAAQEDFDLRQRETHVAREPDEQHAVNRFRGVPALASGAVGRREHAHPLIVANRRSIQAGAAGKFSDLHFSVAVAPEK